QQHPRLKREQPAPQNRQILPRPSLLPRVGLDPDPPRRQPEDLSHCAAVPRHVLVDQRRRHRDAGGLHRGGDLMPSALINVPAKAKRGDIIEIKTLMSHVMETGYRHTASGEVVPRDIITSFTCRYNGNEVFRADLFPAIA